jgi:signal transduction histidine kinase
MPEMQEQDRLRSLADLAELASDATDVDALLAEAVRIAAPGFATGISIELADGEIFAYPTGTSARSQQAGASPLLGQDDDRLPVGAHDGRAQGVDSTRTVPIVAGRQALGVIRFSGGAAGGPEGEAEFLFATACARLLALALERLQFDRRISNDSWVRTQILSTISHDLRTPLTTIRGVTQLLLRRRGQMAPAGNPQVDDRLTLIDRAAVQLGGMIDEVLDFARLETGSPLELHLESVDLSQLVRRVAEEQQATTDEHDVRVESPEEPVVGRWDGQRIERIVRKVVSNAVHYSPAGGRVRISVTRDRQDAAAAAWADVTVSDDGVGIPAGDLPSLLGERPRTSGNSRGRRGGRLNLSGCRQIVEQHNGRMRVQSEEGKGATFTISLPIPSEPAPTQSSALPISPRTSPTSPS